MEYITSEHVLIFVSVIGGVAVGAMFSLISISTKLEDIGKELGCIGNNLEDIKERLMRLHPTQTERELLEREEQN